jgi:hypothetical protein
MALTAKQQAESMAGYLEEGANRALSLGNREPVRFVCDQSIGGWCQRKTSQRQNCAL